MISKACEKIMKSVLSCSMLGIYHRMMIFSYNRSKLNELSLGMTPWYTAYKKSRVNTKIDKFCKICLEPWSTFLPFPFPPPAPTLCDSSISQESMSITIPFSNPANINTPQLNLKKKKRKKSGYLPISPSLFLGSLGQFKLLVYGALYEMKMNTPFQKKTIIRKLSEGVSRLCCHFGIRGTVRLAKRHHSLIS